jgi:hypothetical protein
MKRLFLLFLLLLPVFAVPVFSQTKSLQLGVKFMGELTLWDGIAPGAGIQLVYRLAKHGGFETGINWQNRGAGTFFTEGPSGGPAGGPYILYQSEIRSHRLQVPLLYRFNSNILNFTAGPVIDFHLSTKVKGNDPDPTLKQYKSYGTQILATAGVSHSFRFGTAWILEPEITFNYVNKPSIEDDDGGLGINLSLRKKIF